MGGPSYPYRGRAIMKYKPPPQPGHSAEQTAQQFAFAKGDTITVTGQADDEGDWLEGEKDGIQGVFPAGFVEPLEEEETASSADAVADRGTAASAPPAAHAAPSAPSTVEATPSDPTNVIEAQQDSAPVSPPKQETTLREPESAVEKPTLADVTPKSAEPTHENAAAAPTSPSKATAAGESDGTTTKAHPPPPARKPNALASRIAAFNAAASAQAAEPPVPRPKPKQWRPPTVAAAVPALAQPKSATSPKSPTLDLPAAHITTEARSPTAHTPSDGREEHAAGAEHREFSAEDAQESISRGGGSLRDRIKALQGGGAGGLGARVDPSAKPWKKHANTDESVAAESSAPTTATEADPIESIEPINLQHPEENLRDAVVLDSPPAIEHRTAEEPQSDIPGFEPAEEDDDDEPSAPSATVARADDASEPTQSMTATSATESATSSTDKSADATAGQRVGLPMPALPKRAAGPRARKAKSPAAAVPASTNPMENVATSSDAPAAATSAAKASRSASAEKDTTVPQDDVLTSMGGASKLLAADDDDDKTERSKVPVDDDDFETPAAPPAAPTSRPPVPPTQRSFDEPHLEEGEEEINVAQYSPRTDDVPQRTIAEEAVDALPSTDEPAVEEAAPLSPAAGRPPLPPPFVRQVTEENEDADVAEAKTDDDDEAPKVPPTRQPPIPTHQPPPGQESITTAAEDAYLNKMPDILTPPEEAADESTAAPELNAPTTETIAQTRHEAGHHPAEMAQPTFGKMEGTATPAVERSPPLLAQRNVAGISGLLAQPSSHHEESEQAGGSAEAGGDGDEEEEEEEDPEIARRRALAARMAKLGGRGPLMGGPMLGFGGLPPKKPAKKKSTAESADAAAEAPVPRIESQGTPRSHHLILFSVPKY